MTIILGSYSDQIGLLLWTPGHRKSVFFPANPNPSWLHWEKADQILFAVEEAPDCGRLHSYRLDPRQKRLEPVSSVESQGAYPCHILAVPELRELWLSNYMGGPVCKIRYTGTGTLSHQSSIQHRWPDDAGLRKGTNAARQEMSHPHSCLLAPERNGFYTADLGLDQIIYHPLDAPDKEWEVVTRLPAAYGPRHMCLSRDGAYLYVICELQPWLLSFKVGADGQLEPVQQCRITEQKELSQCSEICLHPRLPYLYAANRNAGYIAQINAGEAGALRFVREFPLRSKNPRHIAISPDGEYLFAALQDSDQIQIFSITAGPEDEGNLCPELESIPCEKPAFIGFI